MAKTAGLITLRMRAGTAELFADMEKAKAKFREFKQAAESAHGGLNTRFAVFGLKDVLEGRSQNAVAELVNVIQGMKGAPAIFAGATAGVAAIGWAAYEARKHFRELAEEPQAIAAAFREFANPIRNTLDELRLSNLRLQNDIAKLEGHRQNKVAEFLAEAKLAADKLGESLEKDIRAIDEVLKKRDIGWIRKLLGEAGTTDIQRLLAGETGSAGFFDALSKAPDNSSRLKLFAGELAYIRQLISESERLQTLHDRPRLPNLTGETGVRGAGETASDQTNRLQQLREIERGMSLEIARIDAEMQNEVLSGKKRAAEQSESDKALTRTFRERVATMQAEIAGIKTRLENVDMGEPFRIAADGAAEAVRIIADLNKEFEKQHLSLTKSQESQIRKSAADKAAANAELSWQQRRAETIRQIQEQSAAQQLLARELGKGFEAQQRASAVVETLKQQGFEKFYANGMDTGLYQQNLKKLQDEHAKRSTEAVVGLEEQLRAEKALAMAQLYGAEVVRKITLENRLRDAELRGAKAAELRLIREVAEAQHQAENNATLSQLQQKLETVKAVAAAQIHGAEATRKAELEAKYAAMERAGAAANVVEAERLADAAEFQQRITAEALRTGMEYKNHLETLRLQIAALKEIQATHENNYEITRSMRNLEDERLRTMRDQALSMRGAGDGVRAFFLDMQTQGKSTAQSIYEAMNAMTERTSRNLAKLVTGQQAEWKRMFQDIAENLAYDEIYARMKQGLGAMGKLFMGGAENAANGAGGKLKGGVGKLAEAAGVGELGDGQGSSGKPDGSEQNPWWVRVMGDVTGGPGDALGEDGLAGFGDLASILGRGHDSKDNGEPDLGTLLGIAKIGFGGFFAEGGAVSPGSAYIVGERGPELFSPSAAGSITDSAATQRILGGGGPSHYYTIDARGTDPVLTEQRVRQAIIAAHGAAVQSSVKVNSERLKRMPASMRFA